MLFSGLHTALITPFKNNQIDEDAFTKLIEFQIANGVSGIVPCGTTGESPTLTHKEHNLVIELAVKISNNRVKVIAGTGSNSTAEAIMTTLYAKEAGADACLVVAPYYNKPTGEGLYQHFKAINDNCDVPLIIYNIPGRSAVNISDEVLARLAKLKNIKGIKDATGDLARVASLKLLVDDDFSILSGDDVATVGFNAMGGCGLISVTANIAPKLCSELQKATLGGDFKRALEIQDQLTSLNLAMFLETNPIPVKYAASLMGICEADIRLPLTPPSQMVKDKIESEMKKLGLIKNS
ncbi:MAG: 4-hydroxy-tetrahydrodipicolinate synthase [Rickettsiales bacterium]|jgi:4-hydroxy-tetrahydrodipicolinate synthase